MAERKSVLGVGAVAGNESTVQPGTDEEPVDQPKVVTKEKVAKVTTTEEGEK